MKAKWQNWMLAGQHSFTAGGLTHQVELDEICRWISDAWHDIPPEMVAKSFHKSCITKALDGTEDDEIWEENESVLQDSRLPYSITPVCQIKKNVTFENKREKVV